MELIDLISGNCFMHNIHKGKGEVLNFVLAESPHTDLMVVTARAREMMQFAARWGSGRACVLDGRRDKLVKLRTPPAAQVVEGWHVIRFRDVPLAKLP